MPAQGAGDLRERLKFSKPHEQIDEWGNVVHDWQEMFVVWGQITPRLSGETVESARLAGRTIVIIRLRQTKQTLDIGNDWKATNLRNGVEFNLRSVVDPGEGDATHGKWRDILGETGVAI